ncbi:filament-like plant protein 3 [Zingiber officinale]|uniref:Filament-like plant protein 3 n=1 Tax=Zingiber officinale TaxID=94328 RepID=A0A8J5HDV0_ZINOF|nr:filament-like plant protein 3 [Zingiber officinale]XP_042464520.1 filament-like plant protein 3 [Zingiber officinale]KAG6526101.1 hypothetical protein ZIOFF_016078 [Zingiber officinale]
MDRRNWLWRRKSSEKSPGVTESSGSASSERHSGEQEILGTSISSPKHPQSPDVFSKDLNHEAYETIKALNDKLSASLLNISAREDLVTEHAKVAEEAVLGWENAEKEVSFLRQQLEAATRKNSFLEDKAIHLEAALKECVRQLRLTREEQEQKVQDAILKETQKRKSEKSELELHLIELLAQMDVKTEISNSINLDLQSKIEILTKGNSSLKADLVTLTEDLHMKTLELELSTRTAETVSKQHLDSIKKMAKLEAECHKLRIAARKLPIANEHIFSPNSHYVESVTDSQSDAGERLLSINHEQICSDSRAPTLSFELSQFRKGKDSPRNLESSVEISLMDDFIEMERLVALPEIDHGNSSIEHDACSDLTVSVDSTSRKELEAVNLHVSELDKMIGKMNTEKVEMEESLAVTNIQLKDTCKQVEAAEVKLVELQRQLNLINDEKHALELELEAKEGKKNEMEVQLELAHAKNVQLTERITILDSNFEEEKKLSAKLRVRCQNIEATEAKRKEMELQLGSAVGEIAELKGKIRLLGQVEGGKMMSTELASRCWKIDQLEHNKELESQLEFAKLKIGEQHDKANITDRKPKEDKAFSEGLVFECQNVEVIIAKNKELKCQLCSQKIEVSLLREKVNVLEAIAEKERVLASEISADLEATKVKRNELVLQLESAHMEIKNLQEKFGSLEKQFEEEKLISADFAEKYHKLENGMPSKQQSFGLHSTASSNRKLIVGQEKEIVLAAAKLVQCQKTLASLNQQLKLMSNFDVLMLEINEPGHCWS